MKQSEYYKTIELTNTISKAIDNPTRTKIIFGLLREEYLDVTSMSEFFNIPQPTISQHLTILKNAGIIKVTPKDNNRYYSIKNNEIKTLMKNIKAFAETYKG